MPTIPDTPAPAPPPRSAASPRVRVDELMTLIQRPLPNGVRMELRPSRPVIAAWDQVLPMFEGWIPNAELHVRASGLTDRAFSASLEVGGNVVGSPVEASITPGDDRKRSAFSFEVAVPLRPLAASAGSPVTLSLVLPGGRKVPLVKLLLVGISGHGPHLSSVDL